MDTSETNNNTPQITETSTTPEQITPKTSWYTKIKDNPEELDKLRQKERNIINKLKLRRESLPPEL
jgi:thymidylate synthase